MSSTKTQEQKDLDNARSRGVRQAWERERAYVAKGMGTRNWTQDEQKELLETGRVSGYEAHHMSSVSKDPQNADNPDNIQFLTHDEHLAAHDGNYQNAAKGYYDPDTGKTHSFNMEGIKAVEPGALTNPLSEEDAEKSYKDHAKRTYDERVDARLKRESRAIDKNDNLSPKEKEAAKEALNDRAEKAKEAFNGNVEASSPYINDKPAVTQGDKSNISHTSGKDLSALKAEAKVSEETARENNSANSTGNGKTGESSTGAGHESGGTGSTGAGHESGGTGSTGAGHESGGTGSTSAGHESGGTSGSGSGNSGSGNGGGGNSSSGSSGGGGSDKGSEL